MEQEAEQDSLAYVVKRDNRYARVYANYVLGQVKHYKDVHELEQHSIVMMLDACSIRNMWLGI